MADAYPCINHAAPEELANRTRAMRPALPAPDGAEGWYRITNAADEGGTPVAAISIYGDIGSWGITAAAFMDELKAVDAPEIRLSISSPGGDVFDGLAIHNALRSHRAKVTVQVDSLAASIASVIAMAGDRVIMGPHAQLMIHDAAGVTCGNAEEMREYADFLDKQSDNIAGVYQERAGGTVKQWRARMQAETWYFANEAVEAGLADEVAQPARQDEGVANDRAIAAAWDLSVYNYAHTSREQAPPPPLAAVEPPAPTAPEAAPEPPVFDPAAFRAAAVAALDPMPDYQPDHLRSLMAGLASDAPAAPAPAPVEAAYVPPPADTVAEADPETVAVGWFRSLFTAVANDAPAAPRAEQPAPVAPEPPTVYVPEPPPPANEVAVDYMRTLMANAANSLAAPEQAATPDPAPAEPVPALDRTAFERSLREAEL